MDLIKNGKLLSDLRKAKGMTQKQVADRIGVLPKTVSKWATGHGFPDISVVSSLADILGVLKKQFSYCKAIISLCNLLQNLAKISCIYFVLESHLRIIILTVLILKFYTKQKIYMDNVKIFIVIIPRQ